MVKENPTVANPKRMAKVVSEKYCNWLLLKGNQIGSLTESLQAWLSPMVGASWCPIFVGRLRILSSLTWYWGSALERSSRSKCLSKYNQILRIEEELGSKAKFAGRSFRNPLAK